MSNNFRVGQRVVCVEEFSPRRKEHIPQKGGIYTIRSIHPGRISLDKVYLRLHEIVNPAIQYACAFEECCFESIGFRPVVERKTDISIFTKLLIPSPCKETA